MNRNETNRTEFDKKTWVTQFIENFKHLLHLSSNTDNRITNDMLVQIGENDEEKELIQEICEEIDNFHANIREIENEQQSNPELSEGEWLSQKMEEEMQDIAQKLEGRNLTADELKEFRKKVNQAQDIEIETEAKALEEESEFMKQELNNEKEA